jgi:hypothetical protein
MKKAVALVSCASALVLAGCGAVAGALGDSCAEYNEADRSQRQEMVVAWMKDNSLWRGDSESPGVDSPESVLNGFEMEGWIVAMTEHCAANPNDGLYELRPSVGF